MILSGHNLRSGRDLANCGQTCWVTVGPCRPSAPPMAKGWARTVMSATSSNQAWDAPPNSNTAGSGSLTTPATTGASIRTAAV